MMNILRNEIDKIMTDFKNELLTLEDARNKILKLVFKKIEALLAKKKNYT